MGVLAGTGVKMPTGAMLVGEKWLASGSGGTFEHVYPATGQVNAAIALAGASEVDAAVQAAARAQKHWISLTVDLRRDMLFKLADAVEREMDLFTKLNIEDYAPPVSMSPVHPLQLVRYLRYYAGWVDKGLGQIAPASMTHDYNFIEREPFGVVGVIVPWNGPMFGLAMIVAPALAAGNAVVVKPPELAPLTSLLFGELCLEAGLPAGLVNIIPGGPEGGEALVRHPLVRKIHFTGSGATAKKISIAAAERLVPVGTELGGKSANIVFADADIEKAVALTAFQGPLGQSGQSCACGSRILVQDGIYDEFVARLVGFVESATVGDPLDPATMVGPVVSEGSMNRILGIMDSAISGKMGKLLTGGGRRDDLGGGYFLKPTLFGDVDNNTDLARIETFGPVASIMRFKSEEEAVSIANDTEFGLAAFVQTNDLVRAHRVSRQLEAGSVYVNKNSDITPQNPYGGYKQSGVGRCGGVEGLHEFMQVKNIRLGMG
jgi:acyl-CoA reductase-like NAD-dependent aldehyde dehydrogenase